MQELHRHQFAEQHKCEVDWCVRVVVVGRCRCRVAWDREWEDEEYALGVLCISDVTNCKLHRCHAPTFISLLCPGSNAIWPTDCIPHTSTDRWPTTYWLVFEHEIWLFIWILCPAYNPMRISIFIPVCVLGWGWGVWPSVKSYCLG